MAATSSSTLPGVGDQGELRRFRDDVYECSARWPDALFEFADVTGDGNAELIGRYSGHMW
ncbi:hypothetical protein [Catellatospora sichuanensis]|uniref:hypothetical protein n=1 Tax=Catellatospora sichuanensis TaxID=1969805 RepID=UPI001181CC4F|nr:hypothetical protein [Catellatospora sichuanensis]